MIKKSLEKDLFGFDIYTAVCPHCHSDGALLQRLQDKRAKWGGATLKWYYELFQNNAIMNALYSTLLIALISALAATVIGTAAAIGIQGMKKKFRTLYMGLTNIPMLNAEIVMGISLMLLFIAFRITLGFGTILIAHITFNIPT